MISTDKPRKGLVIKEPWISLILAGSKTWELRGSRTSHRGSTALIGSGTGMILGSANLGDVIGPLSSDDLMASLDRHQVARDWNDHASPYPVTFAWVFETPVRWDTPVAYKHPQGAVIWVKL